jgi:O-acetylhomoserine/O-acetylserine sulfhydrylase-like pyridoxal-dependent enzyme
MTDETKCLHAGYTPQNATVRCEDVREHVLHMRMHMQCAEILRSSLWSIVTLCCVISFILNDDKEDVIRFMNALKLASNEVLVADIRTCILHPARETHRQLTDEQLQAAGIHPSMIRLFVGLENVNDIIEDLYVGFNAINKRT